MGKSIKVHYRSIVNSFALPVCKECDIFTFELWECDRCGHRYCADHIIQEGNFTDDIKFICISCKGKREEDYNVI